MSLRRVGKRRARAAAADGYKPCAVCNGPCSPNDCFAREGGRWLCFEHRTVKRHGAIEMDRQLDLLEASEAEWLRQLEEIF